MKAWIISDLHLEFGNPFQGPVPAEADVLICAGDLCTRGTSTSIEWLAANIPVCLPVIFVAGNHEYFGASVQESIKAGRLLRERYPRICFLENEAVDIGDVRFIGGTLWTDFRLHGRDPAIAMAAANAGMNDYRKIKYSKRPYQRFKPIHAYRMHQETRAFLGSELAMAECLKTVVITHHAPAARSVAPGFSNDPLSACYASDMENFIVETRPTLWVHGHVHHRVDYSIGETRVIANPRGYPGERSWFDPGLIIEI